MNTSTILVIPTYAYWLLLLLMIGLPHVVALLLFLDGSKKTEEIEKRRLSRMTSTPATEK